MHLKQPGFTFSPCDQFTKNKERIEKFIQTEENTDFIYEKDLDKACIQHDIAYGKSKDLASRTKSDLFKAFEIANNPKYDCYQKD